LSGDQSGEHDDEFLAAEATDKILDPDVASQGAGEQPQGTIAGVMAVGVRSVA
jgi:hypothetical protein